MWKNNYLAKNVKEGNLRGVIVMVQQGNILMMPGDNNLSFKGRVTNKE
jgi:hypothetical protein